MKRINILILIFLLMICLCSCSGKQQNDTKATSDSAAAEGVITVSSPYADFSVPASFEGKVESEVTSKDPYTLSFMVKEDGTELFSIIVDGDGKTGQLLGTLVGDTENHVLYVVLNDIDPKSEHYEEYSEYQEGLGVLTKALSKDYEFAVNSVVESDYPDVYEIKTDVVSLYYPQKWKDKVTVDVTDNSVKFSSDDVRLFDFVFGETADGQRIGTYYGTPISMVLYTIDKDEYSAERYSELSAMQSDSNFVLDGLEQLDGFSYER